MTCDAGRRAFALGTFGAFCASALLAGVAGPRAAGAQAAGPGAPGAAPEVVVVGRGVAPLATDRVTLTFTVAARAVGAAAAVERHVALLAAVTAAARGAGAPRDGITATPRTLGTGQWFNRAAGIDSIGYVAESTVRVTLGGPGAPADEAALGRVVDAVRAAGATGFAGVTRWATDEGPARAEAVARAVGAACRQAAAAARAAGRTLGPLAGVTVTEVGVPDPNDAPGVPVVWRDGVRLPRRPLPGPDAGAAESAAVAAAVSARWTLRDAADGGAAAAPGCGA